MGSSQGERLFEFGFLATKASIIPPMNESDPSLEDPNSETGSEITQLLARSRAGDSDAFDEAFSLVYGQLKRLARWQMRRLDSAATLSTTILVHEVYLKFANHSRLKVVDGQHLFLLCTRAMRQIVVDHARARFAGKRSNGVPDTSVNEFLAQPGLNLEGEVTFLIGLERALSNLEALDERLAKVAELRFFGGSSVAEVAEILAVSEPTVKRDTRLARAFLQRELLTGPELG